MTWTRPGSSLESRRRGAETLLPADSLATLPPGTYGVNVAVTTNLGPTVTRAGAV